VDFSGQYSKFMPVDLFIEQLTLLAVRCQFEACFAGFWRYFVIFGAAA
jgi:hypothetical protein